jgi:hypothetical protein
MCWTRLLGVLCVACLYASSGVQAQQSALCSPQNVIVRDPTTISTNAAGTNYQDSQRCRWNITAPVGQCVRLEFSRFDTEVGYDFFTLSEPQGSSTLPTVTAVLQGLNPIPNFVSLGPELFVSFTTDTSVVRVGVAASVSFPPMSSSLCRPTRICLPTPSNVPIDSPTTLNTNVDRPNYFSSQRCVWSFAPPSSLSQCIRFVFSKFVLSSSSDRFTLSDESMSVPLTASGNNPRNLSAVVAVGAVTATFLAGSSPGASGSGIVAGVSFAAASTGLCNPDIVLAMVVAFAANRHPNEPDHKQHPCLLSQPSVQLVLRRPTASRCAEQLRAVDVHGIQYRGWQ